MKRLGRWLFNLVAGVHWVRAVSILLFIVCLLDGCASRSFPITSRHSPTSLAIAVPDSGEYGDPSDPPKTSFPPSGVYALLARYWSIALTIALLLVLWVFLWHWRRSETTSRNINRLGHWLFNFAAGLSLALCILCASLWEISRFRSLHTSFYFLKQYPAVWAQDGLLVVKLQEFLAGGPPSWFSTPHLIINPLPRTPAPDLFRIWQGEIKTQYLGFGFWFSDAATRQQVAQAWKIQSARRAAIAQRAGRASPSALAVFDTCRILMPIWLFVLITAFLPAHWAYRLHKARRRMQQGICRKCGYDLRATPQRCPECGSSAQPNGVNA